MFPYGSLTCHTWHFVILENNVKPYNMLLLIGGKYLNQKKTSLKNLIFILKKSKYFKYIWNIDYFWILIKMLCIFPLQIATSLKYLKKLLLSCFKGQAPAKWEIHFWLISCFARSVFWYLMWDSSVVYSYAWGLTCQTLHQSWVWLENFVNYSVSSVFLTAK